MTRTIALVLIAGLAVATAACTESKRARNAATWGDKPADITCWTYGTETFSGRSTGKVEHSEEGRIAFVDAANGRYTTVDGDCRVVYLAEGEAGEPTPVAVTPAPAPAAVLPETTPAQ
ncbi:hypothetical protein [Brevundimonas sp.]|uniref:hypothetical protein n=1 Tax=Brevundimonas sp. TaxID=1871086 RepID=UPI00286BC546|nr:hypothetical protein [Brevundimonas sp.]